MNIQRWQRKPARVYIHYCMCECACVCILYRVHDTFRELVADL